MANSFQISYQFLANDSSFTKTVENVKKSLKGYKDTLKSTLSQPITFAEVAQTAMKALPLYGLTKAVGVAKDFEYVMKNIEKVRPDLKAQDFQSIKNDVLEMSQKLPKSATEIGRAYQQIIQDQRIAKHEIKDFLLVAEQAGVAFDMDIPTTTKQLQDIRGNFKLNNTELKSFGDAIAYTHHHLGRALVPDILNTTSALAGLAVQNKVSKEGVIAFSAAILNSGIDASRTQNALKTLIVNTGMLGNVLSPKKMGFLKSSGIDVKHFSDLIKKDATGGIVALLEAIKKSPESKKALLGLVGREYVDVISGLVNNLEDAKHVIKDLAGDKHIGEMAHAYKTISQTFEVQSKRMKYAIEGVSIAVGTALLPALANGTGGFANMLHSMSMFIHAHPHLVQAFAAVIAAVAASKIAILAMRLQWQAFFLKDMILIMRSLWVAVGGFTVLGTVINIALGPLGLLSAALAGLTGVLHLFGSSWDGVWKNLKSGFGQVYYWIVGKLEKLMKMLTDNWFARGLGNMVDTVKNTLGIKSDKSEGKSIAQATKGILSFNPYDISHLSIVKEAQARGTVDYKNADEYTPQINVNINQSNVIDQEGKVRSKVSAQSKKQTPIQTTVRVYQGNSIAARAFAPSY